MSRDAHGDRTTWEYRVIPAPRRAARARGVKTTEERFALALQEVMNEMGAEGWDYRRSDVLPVDERQGLTGRTTSYHTLLVFRRARPGAATPEAGTEARARPALSRVAEPGGVAGSGVAGSRPADAAAAPSAPILSVNPPVPPGAPALGPARSPDPAD